jgi:uncharacterized repeat protein (TIGR03803 family)
VAALAFVIVFVAAVVATRSAQAQTFSVLYSFNGGNNGIPDGAYPSGLVRDALSGNLYGTTSAGGDLTCDPNGCGTVFKVDTTGKNETVLYSFKGYPDGSVPLAGLVRAGGNLYGTTSQGGAYGYARGTVFKVDKTGHETVLYSFKVAGQGDGVDPEAGLVRDALSGNLYGTTYIGGTYVNYGTVFKVDKTGHETVLYSFTGGTDGGNPWAGLIRDANGNLYGTTTAGGDLTCRSSGCGTVFKVDATGNETVLHSFTGFSKGDGNLPTAGLLLDGKGNLYGTTIAGGAYNYGTVFKVDATGHETVLYSFTGGTDGDQPWSGLIRDAKGNLYGTTQTGGVYNYGTAFKLDKTGNETVLHSFNGTSDGSYPRAGLVRDALSGNLYGTTTEGGDLDCNSGRGCGTVFKLTP